MVVVPHLTLESRCFVMADVTRGITFQSDEEVTAAKMHQGIESATVTGIIRSDMDVNDTAVIINPTAPTAGPAPVAGHVWYDTTDSILRVYDGSKWKAVSRGGTFTNRSGITLSSGAVVVLDTGNAESVTTTTTADDTDVVGVVIVGGDDLSDVIVITEGFVPDIDVTGSTSIGDYLTTSTTAAESDSVTSAGSGTYARALSTSATSVQGTIGGAIMTTVASGATISTTDEVSFSKSTATPSGTSVIAHGLGRLPSVIQFHGFFDASNPNNSVGYAAFVDDSTYDQICVGSGASDGTVAALSGYCVTAGDTSSAYMRGTITAVTTTNFTITWSEVGSTTHATANFAATLFA
jgi:hypothetical protein